MTEFRLALLQLITNAYRVGYSLTCQPVDYAWSGPEFDIAFAIYLFYFSKLIEFADSFFFVLRCKPQQLSFLHIYHHSTMPNLWWIGTKWVAGGSGRHCFTAVAN